MKRQEPRKDKWEGFVRSCIRIKGIIIPLLRRNKVLRTKWSPPGCLFFPSVLGLVGVSESLCLHVLLPHLRVSDQFLRCKCHEGPPVCWAQEHALGPSEEPRKIKLILSPILQRGHWSSQRGSNSSTVAPLAVRSWARLPDYSSACSPDQLEEESSCGLHQVPSFLFQRPPENNTWKQKEADSCHPDINRRWKWKTLETIIVTIFQVIYHMPVTQQSFSPLYSQSFFEEDTDIIPIL